MSKFYEIDVSGDDDEMSYADICEQNSDKWGTSSDANAKIVSNLRAEAFERHLDGKITLDEWCRVDDELEARGNEPK